MTMFSHKFCGENNNHLLNFLQVANQYQSSRYCDLEKYETLSKYFPLDRPVKDDLKGYNEIQNMVIDITESDEEETEKTNYSIPTNMYSVKLGNTAPNINRSLVDDITFSIKEHLETQKCISRSILNNLCESNVQEEIFSLLANELGFEEILNFGLSLKSASVRNDMITSYYFEHLLLKELNLEFSDKMQDVLKELSIEYSEILIDKLVIKTLFPQSSNIFLQYIDELSINFKAKLFRKFVFTCESFQESHIDIIEILISPQVEYDSLNKLVEVLSHSTDMFSSNKSFGKLLMNVIKLLGRNVLQLKQPLEHIIGSHNSIWKSKIRKTFDDCLQDSLIMSQSFR